MLRHILPATILLSSLAIAANATLLGTAVTGSLTFGADPSNYFDPGYNFVPAGYLNSSGTTVTIGNPAVEFGYDDGSSLISADFSAGALTIQDHIELSGATNAFQLMFSDAAFAGQSLVLKSDSFPLTSYSIAGDVITLDYAGANQTIGQTLSASFTVAPVPEPATFDSLAIPLLAALAALARNLRRKNLNLASASHNI